MKAPTHPVPLPERGGEPPASWSAEAEGVLSRDVHPVVVTDAQRRIQWVNAAFVELTGYTLEDAVGRTPGELLQCEETDPATVERMRVALNAGERVVARLINRARDGRRYWVELDIQPFGPPGMPPAGFIAVQPGVPGPDDATQRLRTLLACSAAGVILQDGAGRIVDCNAAAEVLLDCSKPQLLGKTAPASLRSPIAGEGPQPQWPAAQVLTDGRPVRDAVVAVQRADGRQVWLTVNAAALPREAGLGGVISSFTEVPAERDAHLRAIEQWQTLRRALAFARAASWEWDLRTHRLRFDPHWASMMGWPATEDLSLSRADIAAMVHPDDLATSDRLLREHLRGQHEDYVCEMRLRHQDGHWLWMLSRGRVTRRDAAGRALQLIGTHEDISARKAAEQSTQLALGMLQGLFETAPIGISRVDIETMRNVDFNPALCAMLGRDREALLKEGNMLAAFEPSYAQRRAELVELALRTGHCGPQEAVMHAADGRRIDVVVSGSRVVGPDGRAYLWSLVQDVSASKAMEAGLRANAETDALTGLPNRQAFMQRLAAQLAATPPEARRHLALLFLDFDRFKLVNDTLGHDAGDQLLVEMASRLRAVTHRRPGTGGEVVFARLGGDEFICLASGIDGEPDAQWIADRLQGVLAQPYLVKGHEIESGVSIGIAMGDGGDGTAHSLLRNADTAMYEAKRQGRRRSMFFDGAMHTRLLRSLQIEAGLRHAEDRGEFSVFYQPIVDLNTGRMTSVEALLRWQHPELGPVSPAEFIPIAEDSGLIVPIGEWVLRQACHQWSAWQRADPQAAPEGVSVNLSRVQMALGQRLVLAVHDALDEAGVPPSALQLEITEREVMNDPRQARELMLALKSMGVRLAMDDFGTGASSLGCLRDYPFDVIKIDKSFVTDLGRDRHVLAVAHATVSVIQNLGMSSVAEGIEDLSEVAVLQSMGCRYGQGYLFARPMPGDRLLAAMAPPA